jgi:hypothetical protein
MSMVRQSEVSVKEWYTPTTLIMRACNQEQRMNNTVDSKKKMKRNELNTLI